jgi:hypothetical protein
MTQEIIQMARDSGMELYGLGKDRARFVHHLEAFAKLVAEAEREACAKECWKQMGLLPTQAWAVNPYEQCIDAIRARGTT